MSSLHNDENTETRPLKGDTISISRSESVEEVNREEETLFSAIDAHVFMFDSTESALHRLDTTDGVEDAQDLVNHDDTAPGLPNLSNELSEQLSNPVVHYLIVHYLIIIWTTVLSIFANLLNDASTVAETAESDFVAAWIEDQTRLQVAYPSIGDLEFEATSTSFDIAHFEHGNRISRWVREQQQQVIDGGYAFIDDSIVPM